jgi:hypothetical protein
VQTFKALLSLLAYSRDRIHVRDTPEVGNRHKFNKREKMIDIIGQLLLTELKKIEGFEHAVIAGGMVRDSHLGGDWKDIDVFTPHQWKENLEKINLVKDGNQPDLKGYDGQFIGDFYVVNYKYHDTIPVQIIQSPFKDNSKEYGEQLIERFNYGIDQAYWDGQKEGSTDLFKQDVKYGTATLCRLDNISDLPEAISKFSRLKEKYPHCTFNSNILEIKKTDKTLYFGGSVKNKYVRPIINQMQNPAAEIVFPNVNL